MHNPFVCPLYCIPAALLIINELLEDRPKWASSMVLPVLSELLSKYISNSHFYFILMRVRGLTIIHGNSVQDIFRIRVHCERNGASIDNKSVLG